MTSNPFLKATKEKAFLRLALVGVSGGGKTYSALNIAQHLVPGGKVAVIDTEHGSASKYAGIFDFDTVELSDFKPASYVAMIKAAAANGYDVVIVDSLTHAWDALLAMKDDVAKKDKGQNSFTAWAKINPHHNNLIDAIVGTPIHIIGTMRAKSDYVMEEYTYQGKVKTKPVKVGMKAMQRDGFEYEFDVYAQMDIENNMIIEKSRCPELTGEVIEKPGAEIAETLRVWLSDGVEPAPNMHLYASIDGKEMFNETLHVDAHPPHQDTPRAQPKAPAPHSAPPPEQIDDFPTIDTLWGHVASGLLITKVSDLPEGVNVGSIIYPVATAQLGYKDDDAVKALLELGSLKEWQGTLEGLMNRVIELADEG